MLFTCANTSKPQSTVSRFFSTVGLILAFALMAVFYFRMDGVGFYHGDGQIYVSNANGLDMILQINPDNTMSLYRYSDEKLMGFTTYYGVHTEYEYHATTYNNVIGPLHYLPEERLFFWQNFALYDGDHQERALLVMKAVTNRGLNVDATQTAAVSGTFREILIIEPDRIMVGDIEYVKADGIQLHMAKDVIDRFKRDSVPFR